MCGRVCGRKFGGVLGEMLVIKRGYSRRLHYISLGTRSSGLHVKKGSQGKGGGGSWLARGSSG